MKILSNINENKDVVNKEYTENKINDAGYLTSFTETDPTVPAWAKAASKPSYSASEVGALSVNGGTIEGNLTLNGQEIYYDRYIKRSLGWLDPGTSYANLDSAYKDGTYHRMWRLRFPAGCNHWGKIKVTLYGTYSSFNASGNMSKVITCNFNGGNLYNNLGSYDSLGVNVEKDFRISEAIWNSTASAWEILIWQVNLSGNNSPFIIIESWAMGSSYLNAIVGMTVQPVELVQDTTYTALRATGTGGTKEVTWATVPVFETPLGYEVYDTHNLPTNVSYFTNDAGYLTTHQNITGKADLVDGKVPSSQLPSYVDDVIEASAYSSFPTTGESGKIYVDISTNKTYRWTGSAYTEISASLALGENSSTAYRGDRGKIAYDHSQVAHAPSNAEANVQSDWNITDTSSDAYIKNKPSIPTIPAVVSAFTNDAGYLTKQATFYGVCTGTAAAQTATIDGITEYYDGLTVMLHINVATQCCATININNIGDAYLRARGDDVSATSTSTTYLAADRDILFVYVASENVFRAVWSYEGSNTTDTLTTSYMRRYVGSNPLYRYKICGVDSLGKFQPLTLEDGTDATKTPNSTPINPDLFYTYTSSGTVASGSTVSASYILAAGPTTAANYTFNGTLTTYRTVYLKGTLNSSGMLVLDTTNATSWYVLVPNNASSLTLSSYFETGYVYVLLGFSYSTSNYFWLNPAHPRYAWNGTGLIPYEKAYIDDIISSGVVGSNVQADWNQTNTTADDYIKNKPNIPVVPGALSSFANDVGYSSVIFRDWVD